MVLRFLQKRLWRRRETIDPIFLPQDEGVSCRPMFDDGTPPEEGLPGWDEDLKADGLPLSLLYPCLIPKALRLRGENKTTA